MHCHRWGVVQSADLLQMACVCPCIQKSMAKAFGLHRRASFHGNDGLTFFFSSDDEEEEKNQPPTRVER
jgi:hypothetical protein